MQGDSPLTTNVLPLSSLSDLEQSELQTTLPQRSASASTSRSDLLRRNLATGEIDLWQINTPQSSTQNSKSQPLSTLPDQNDQLVGIGDFSGNAQDDLLWWNAATGAVKIWTIEGETVRQSTVKTVSDLKWQITNIGDFDQDGKLDLLWRNVQTGEVAFWLLNRTEFSASVYLPTISDLNWEIEHVGDFNRDRSLDIQWRNRQTGAVDIWLLDKTERSQSVTLGTVDLAWNIQGVGDFDGAASPLESRDRSLDLLWRNEQTGENVLWLLNGTEFKQAVSLPSNSLDWQIVSTADLNADGNLDLLWHHPTTGATTQWFLDQGSFTREEALQIPAALDWQPLGILSQGNFTDATSGNASPSPVPIPAEEQPQALVQGDSLSTAIVKNSPVFAVSDQVNSSNLNDFYQFSIGQSGVFTASLTGLTGDADIKLIQDINGNGAIDTGEVLAYQWERGTTSESLRRFLDPGAYYVQVLSYGTQASAYSLSTDFSAAAQDDQKFSINLSFSTGLEGLGEAARAAIAEAAKFWETIITSRSAITEFQDLTITLSGQNLVTQSGAADTSTLALAGPTFGISTTDTLVIRRGRGTINARKFDEFNANPLYLRNIMIHEFAHILGFGTAWEPIEFVDYDGTRFSMGKTWIDRTSATYLANTYAGYAYGDLLGAGGAVAVPIEQQVFAHWDEGRFDSELMTPFAEGAGVATPLSLLTLAALRDLGWNVNSGATQAYTLPNTAAQQPALLSSNSASTSQRQTAALQCGCGKCLAVIRGEPLAPTRLEDALWVARTSESNSDQALLAA
ncbi:FG-GAP-like repeat-containing protein [Myxacorys almedinensis]|uniref:Peptidase C-terminal archaeal/bacterial domain-containing protein n=1 Tax=Myxacorys almedinensis A TaxID=2690445 RepID=A0A8J7Z424_9CYAN|nr:FG-GAP-like repeat-containing protein [Myxacorys almedinensis]NDJ19597.1 hypothetical protein [Myxacorys almedinensis A]